MTVFISYANEDKHVAQAACANLEAAGISCCLAPRDVTPGARPHVATEAIDHCRVFVVIVSENTNRSLRVWLEVEQAVNRGVLLIPVRIQATTPAPALASYLVTVHWLDALTPPLEIHLQLLADKVKRLLAINRVSYLRRGSTEHHARFPRPRSDIFCGGSRLR
jgi:hypothetical protein